MSVNIKQEQLEKLKNQFGEAFYILDSDQFRQNFIELKDAFSKIYSNFNIAYSYKTNYTPKLCKIVNDLGGYAEVVSEMELELAQRIGVKPENIIWNGPIKNPKIVEEYLLKGGVINIDSIEEVHMLRSIVEMHPNNTFRLGIRCNYDVNDGVLSRFGIDVDSSDFDTVLSFVTGTTNVKLIGLQCHFAKRHIDYWSARVKGMIDLIDRIGIVPERVDLGGALFGKMADSLKAQFSSTIPSYSDYANSVAKAFANRFGKNGPELIIEPGSALVGDCMKFIGTVKSIKCIRGKYIASVLGSQKNISMTGVNPPIEIIPCGNEQKEYKNLDFVGYTCIEGDVLYKNYSGKLAIDDTIVISNCGSYSLVMKPPFILPNFSVVDICGEKVEVVKEAETFDDIFHTFKF
jgi:diaminopimelate decarboxylase